MAFEEIIRNLRGRPELQTESRLPVTTVRTVDMDWNRCPRGSYSCTFKFDRPEQEIPEFLSEISSEIIEIGNPPFFFSCHGVNVKVEIGDPNWGPTGLELECAKNISSIYNDLRHTYDLTNTEAPNGY